ncbi:Aste57867_3023 [Aphanomyces stellatus]|uniref:Aste57867_3023 protein n=1 Tax=Aphanomyces stellatus TaxID=120398 RepID=A0A485K9I2_9STRA|nr:hypothetical protein As57867_003014 [Aphanomyces stellatus]VFT80203.1 Aste57867_3023 [Aphanomyces stellatus]
MKLPAGKNSIHVIDQVDTMVDRPDSAAAAPNCSPRKKLMEAQAKDRELSDMEPSVIFDQRPVSGQKTLSADEQRRLHINLPSNRANEVPALARVASTSYVNEMLAKVTAREAK